MGLQITLWIFCFIQFFCLGFSKEKLNIGILTYNDEWKEFNWDLFTHNADFNVTVRPIKVAERECLGAANSFCNSAAEENGLTAVFGVDNKEIGSTLEAVSNHFGIPYIATNWSPRNIKEYDTSFSLYPEASLLSRAYGAVVASLDWPLFAVVYESEESLIKLQDVIKLQEYSTDSSKNTLILKKLNENGDNRPIFKALRRTPIISLVIDCSTNKIISLLQQAKEVSLLDDLNANIFLTSLDAHTLDYSVLQTKANITTVRLFASNSYAFERYSRKYYPDLNPSQITVKTALMHDAMLLLAESLNAIKSTHADGEIVYEPLFCNATEKYNDKYGLVSSLQETVVHGMTGEINLINRKREIFELNVVQLSNLDKPIGIWNNKDPNRVLLTRNATEREAELQRRIQSHNFIVTSRIGEPYLFKNNDTEATGNARYYGYSMDLIIEIAKLLNITFEFKITENNEYPNLQKDLIERRADLAICDFTITPQRREVIDFSSPFMSLGIGILHKKVEEDEDTNIYGFLGPLSPIVWMYIALLYTLISFVLVLIARFSSGDWENPHPCDQNPTELENIWDLKNCCWLTLGSITTQGCDILPKGVCTRIATASWWLFSLIITSTYTANLAAFLTMSKKDDSIESVDELATQSKVKYGCVKDGSTANFFANSNNSLYQRIWNTMLNEKPSVFEKSNLKGVDRVNSTKNALYAFFMESTGIEYEMERKCDLRRIGDLLDSKSYGIGMPMNAEYRHSINTAVLKLQESGKLGDLKEKWWKIEREGEPCPSDVPVSSDALALANVGGVFIVLGAGLALAILIAIVEFFWNAHNVAVEEHMSYLEALKIEVKFACNVLVTKKRSKPLKSESSSASSEKDEVHKSNGALLTGVGSFLNVNASVLNRIGSSMNNVDNASAHTRKSMSKRSS